MVVSNTSPLSALARVDRLDLLREQSGEVFVPQAVWDELHAWNDRQALLKIDRAFNLRWLKIRPVRDRLACGAILKSARLDPGETEAIVLAIEQKAQSLIIDDAEGRSVAEARGLTCRGTLGVLLHARKTGRIPSLEGEIHRLKSAARFFISPALERQALRAVGELD